MARYPWPHEVNWSEGLQEAPQYINTVTHGIVMNLILLGIIFIIGSGYWFARRDLPGALAAGSFVAWLFGFFFWLGDMIGDYNFIFITAVMVLSFVSLGIERE